MTVATTASELARALGVSRSYLSDLRNNRGDRSPWFPREGPWRVDEVRQLMERHLVVRPARRSCREPAPAEQLESAGTSAPAPVTPADVAQALDQLAELDGAEAIARYDLAHREARQLLDAAMLGSDAPAGLEDAAAELGGLIEGLAGCLAERLLVSRDGLGPWLRELLAPVAAWSAGVEAGG